MRPYLRIGLCDDFLILMMTYNMLMARRVTVLLFGFHLSVLTAHQHLLKAIQQ